jgi:putative flavoprotein involved in K+ transport
VTDHGSVTQVPGLWFLGLPFQVGVASTLLRGVGRDAELLMFG